MSQISIKGVKKNYLKTTVIHGVDVEIEAGEFVVILGPSGCGKSTLLRMIAGLESITAGEISIGGKVVNQLEPRERGCAMVFQNYALYPHMTVRQNIGYSLKVAKVPKPERDARVMAVAQSVGLETFLDRRPGELSGGQRQRVAMARAMVREPKVTSVFVTHDQVEAMTLADKLIIMNAGNVEQIGKPTEVYNNPASRFVADFIGSPAMNLFEGEFDAEGHFVHGQGGKLMVSQLNGVRAPGKRVVLGVRPEGVRRTGAETHGAIPAVVDYVEELGASRLIHADANGSRIVALDTDTAEITTGTPVHLSLADSTLHLFSLEDGRRISH